jgi:hypothetical protein
MIPGFAHCYSKLATTLWCICREGDGRTLCGREVGFAPVDGVPAHPTPACQVCRAAMYGTQPVIGSGTCPACEGDVELLDGRVQPHGVVRVNGAGGQYESAEPCLGVNMAPKRGRR